MIMYYTCKSKIIKRFLREFDLTKCWSDYLKVNAKYKVKGTPFPDEIFGTTFFTSFINEHSDADVDSDGLFMFDRAGTTYSVTSLFRMFLYIYYYDDVTLNDGKDVYFNLKVLNASEIKDVDKDDDIMTHLLAIGGDKKMIADRLQHVFNLLNNKPLRSTWRQRVITWQKKNTE